MAGGWNEIIAVDKADAGARRRFNATLKGLPGEPLATGGAWTARDVASLVDAHPGADPNRTVNATVSLTSDSPVVSEVKRAGFEVLGAVPELLYGLDEPFSEQGLLQLAFGADKAAVDGRAKLLGTKTLVEPPPPPPPPAPGGGLPGLPGLPSKPTLELDAGTFAMLSLRAALHEFAAAAAGSNLKAYNDWVAAAVVHARGITSVEPFVVQAGDEVRVEGSFDAVQPDFTTVRLPTQGGHCTDAKVLSWSPTEIVVRAPADIGPGAVGFLVTPGPAPRFDTASASTAAQQVSDILGDFDLMGGAWGAAASFIWGSVANNPPVAMLPCPALLRRRPRQQQAPNEIHGGPPVVRRLQANGRTSPVVVHPGDSILLEWDVAGAAEVTLTSADLPWVSADPPAELPDLGTQPPVGSASTGPLQASQFYDWRGRYDLVAMNRAGTVSAGVVVELREHKPLFGIADVHVHFLAHLASGGYAIHGKPHPADPGTTGEAAVRECLPPCDSGPRSHGAGGVLPTLDGAGGHLVGGSWGDPMTFDGWPRHNTLAHQMTYLDWIRRAYDGGLRLAVCLANNSELLSATAVSLRPGPPLAGDDQSAIDRQVMAMKDLAAFVAAQTPAGEQPWLVIAETPAEARAAVAANQLAMVIGVEVDSLGGWHTPGQLEQAAADAGTSVGTLVEQLVQALFDKGVRHIFPLHGTNNAFGGAALFQLMYDPANTRSSNASLQVEPAPADAGIAWRLDAAFDTYATLTGQVTLAIAYGYEPNLPLHPKNWRNPVVNGLPNTTGHINAQGTTPHMSVLLRHLMKRGMVIDVDHMGHKTTDMVLTEMEARGYPVVSGHAQFRELKPGYAEARAGLPWSLSAYGTSNPLSLSSEIDKSPETIARIRALGGLIAPILIQNTACQAHGGVGHPGVDNPGSSKSFGAGLEYAAARMRGRGVAIGSDINGAAPMPSPRFGPNGAHYVREEKDYGSAANRRAERRHDVLAQAAAVLYDSPPREYRHARFPDYTGDPADANGGGDVYPFDAEERDFWEALTVVSSGTRPDRMDHPPIRVAATRGFIENLAWGLRATRQSDLPAPADPVQLAGCTLAGGRIASAGDPAETTRLVARLGAVLDHWHAMTGPRHQERPRALWGRATPVYKGQNLVRSQLGRRDYDINVDGMAHYGLLPDLMQDLHNVGADTDPLFRSAEDYIRVWERCVARSTKIT